MEYTEQEIEAFEDLVPAKAAAAFREAYETTLNAGLSVLAVEGGILYRVYPDRTKEAIKKMPPGVKVKKGTVIRLKHA